MAFDNFDRALVIFVKISQNFIKSLLTLVLLNLVSEEANWSRSALFAIKYVNMHHQSGSSNLICWKLEVSGAS